MGCLAVSVKGGGMSPLMRPQGVTAEALDRALAECERVAAKDRSNLYVTSQSFEDRARYDAFVAMYAVMRLVDDFVDDVPDKSLLSDAQRGVLKVELDRWEQRIRDVYAGRPSSQPMDLALAAATMTFPVPLQVWLDFMNAMRFDVDHPRFADFAEFLAYGEGATVAPTVVYVFLLTSQPQPDGRYVVTDFDFDACGRDLGLFAYVAHILRDVAQDLRMGTQGLVYLSIDDMKRHGMNEADLRRLVSDGKGNDAWRALVADLCDRAHVMEKRGVALAEGHYGHMPPDCAFILCRNITIYSEMLRRIEEQPDLVLVGDPILNSSEKAVLTAAAARKAGYPLSRVSRRHGGR